jgi:hypothetical protein
VLFPVVACQWLKGPEPWLEKSAIFKQEVREVPDTMHSFLESVKNHLPILVKEIQELLNA